MAEILTLAEVAAHYRFSERKLRKIVNNIKYPYCATDVMSGLIAMPWRR